MEKGDKNVYDRGLSVLEQYGLEAVSVRRGRGVLICETAKGAVQIREFCGTQKKLESQAALLEQIAGKTRILTDEILKNQEGSLRQRKRFLCGKTLA